MSQAIHQLEIDQEVTAFSLSVTKNIFNKLGLSKTNASSNTNSSSSFSPIESRLPSIFQTAPRNSSLKRFPSYSFGFSNENQCLSPVVIEEPTTRSNSSDPVQKNSIDQDKYNFSIRIVEPEESAFIENPTDMTVDYGYSEYSYASNALPTVVKVSRGEVKFIYEGFYSLE